jgi:hypothetical protein
LFVLHINIIDDKIKDIYNAIKCEEIL